MDRVFRAIGHFLRQDSGALLGDFHANAGVENACLGNEQDGVEVLFSKRDRRPSSARCRCQGEGGDQRSKTFCGNSWVRDLS